MAGCGRMSDGRRVESTRRLWPTAVGDPRLRQAAWGLCDVVHLNFRCGWEAPAGIHFFRLLFGRAIVGVYVGDDRHRYLRGRQRHRSTGCNPGGATAAISFFPLKVEFIGQIYRRHHLDPLLFRSHNFPITYFSCCTCSYWLFFWSPPVL